jgi:hypothetical protein
VAAQLLHQLLMLPRDRRVAIVATPSVEALEGATQSLHSGFALDDPVALPRASQVVGKAEEIKRPRPSWDLRPLPLGRRGWTGKTNHPRFGGMQRETIFGKPLGEDCHEALCIAFYRAQDHNIVCKAVQRCFPVEPWFDHLLEPRIEDGMQKDIRQERRHYSPNVKENFCEVESHVSPSGFHSRYPRGLLQPVIAPLAFSLQT